MAGTTAVASASKYCTPIIAPQGPGGLASGGRTPMILNAMQLSRQGLMQAIPLYESTQAHQNIGIITGLTETTNPNGSTPVQEPKGCCDPFPVAGLLSMCEWAAAWGLFGRQSRVYSLCDNDDDTCDRPIDVVNAVMAAQAATRGQSDERNFMNSALLKAKYELDATFKRDMAHQYFTGNPKSSHGVFRPFKGIASIINTGYRDAVSGELCPRADSVVISAADYLGVDNACKNAAGFVHLITSLVRNSKHLSEEMGLGITDGVFIGPSWMRDCIIDMWACGYGGCSCCGEAMGTGVVIQQTTERTAQMRDDMMMNSFILVDGMMVPWIVDNSDTYGDYDQTTGERTGRLFYSPITVMNGSVPIFYQQYKPWNRGEMAQAMQEWGGVDFQLPTNNPAWLLFRQTPVNMCLSIAGATKRRLAHHAPFLAFQVTDITVCTFTKPENFFAPGRTEGPLPYPATGIPGGEEMGEIDKSDPYCVMLKNADGEPTPTTVYLQSNGCYVDESGCEVDLGDTCPTAGACAVGPVAMCWNPYADEPAQTVYMLEDGTYNTAEDGSGEAVAVEDGVTGTLWPDACPVPYAPTAWCYNPLFGGAAQTVFLLEDGTYNTAEDGSGDAVEVDLSECTLTEGACPAAKAEVKAAPKAEDKEVTPQAAPKSRKASSKDKNAGK